MFWSNLANVFPLITAIVAVLVPGIATIYTIKINARIKKYELYSPRVYDAVEKMAKAYSSLLHGEELPENERDQNVVYVNAAKAYYQFAETAYIVMSLIAEKIIQKQINKLLSELSNCYYIPNLDHDALFCKLMNDITTYTRKLKV